MTPLIAVWNDGALHFCTGPDEQKARNLEANTHCAVTTGCNAIGEGLDVVVEGDARAGHRRRRGCSAWPTPGEAKYGDDWHFDVRDGAFHHDAGEALVFEVAATTAFGFSKGEPFSQTRWRF